MITTIELMVGKINNILLPIDDSQNAIQGLDKAIEMTFVFITSFPNVCNRIFFRCTNLKTNLDYQS